MSDQNQIPDWKREWQQRAPHAKERHKKLVKRLSRIKSKKVDAAAEHIHHQVFRKVDCLQCGNCCKSIPPILTETDIKRIAKSLGMNAGQFKTEYIVFDEDGDMVMNRTPCPFLGKGNKCKIYEIRPKACRRYPHTNHHEFSKHYNLHLANVNYCPAVFHILERIDKLV